MWFSLLIKFAKESTRTLNDNNNNQKKYKKKNRILNVSKGKSNNNKGRNKFNETKIVVNTRVISNVILLRFLILKYSLCEDQRD